MGNFRVPSIRAVQPRLVRATSTVGNALQQDQLSVPGIRGGPRFAAGSSEGKRSERGSTPTTNERQFARNFSQRSESNSNNLHPLQPRNKDLQKYAEKTQFKTETLRNIAPKGHAHASDIQLKQQADKDYEPANSRGLPQLIHAPQELPRQQLFDSEYSIYSLKRRNFHIELF